MKRASENMAEYNDKNILENWYEYAADLPGSVGSLLKTVRQKESISLQEQQMHLGISSSNFSRLNAMRAPREQAFVSDAQRISEACEIMNRQLFMNWMLLARNLERGNPVYTTSQFYEAAFDARDDLDDPNEE